MFQSQYVCGSRSCFIGNEIKELHSFEIPLWGGLKCRRFDKDSPPYVGRFSRRRGRRGSRQCRAPRAPSAIATPAKRCALPRAICRREREEERERERERERAREREGGGDRKRCERERRDREREYRAHAQRPRHANRCALPRAIQGFLAHKQQRRPRTLQ